MRPNYPLLLLLFSPVFFGPQTKNISLLHFVGVPFQEDGFAIHFNAFIAVIGISLLFTSVPLARNLFAYMVFSVLWLTCSFIAGMVTDPSILNAMFYTQTILPIFSIYFGYSIADNVHNLKLMMNRAVQISSLFIVFLWLVTIVNFGMKALQGERSSVIRELSIGIPQFRNYYPICVLVTFSFALAGYLFGRRMLRDVIFLCIHVSFLPLCWSRTALTGFVLCSAVQVWLVGRLRRTILSSRIFLCGLVMALLIPAMVLSLGTTVSDRLADQGTDAIDGADNLRWNLFVEGLSRSWSNPFVGDMFIPAWDSSPNGKEFNTRRLFLAHNQYVDLLLRGGVPILLAFLFLMGSTAIRCRKLLSEEMWQKSPIVYSFTASVSGVFLAFLVGANFQLYFIQLQTAVPFYFLIGVTHRVYNMSHTRRPTRHLLNNQSIQNASRRKRVVITRSRAFT